MTLVAARIHVLAGQRKAGVIMVKGGRGPRRRTVTLRTIGGESGLGMVRCRGCIVVRHVTCIAVRGCAHKTVGVALHTIHRGMLARQRERRGVVVESGCVPVTLVVAQGAVRGEASRYVVRIRGGVVVRQVAALAGVRRVGVARSVALVAVHVRVRSVQCEAGCTRVVEG